MIKYGIYMIEYKQNGDYIEVITKELDPVERYILGLKGVKDYKEKEPIEEKVEIEEIEEGVYEVKLKKRKYLSVYPITVDEDELDTNLITMDDNTENLDK